jgi:hypothetical protein
MHTSQTDAGWKCQLNDHLSLYGHRNWVVIADAAYPAQAKPGIETILTSESQIAGYPRSRFWDLGKQKLNAHIHAVRELDLLEKIRSWCRVRLERALHHRLRINSHGWYIASGHDFSRPISG